MKKQTTLGHFTPRLIERVALTQMLVSVYFNYISTHLLAPSSPERGGLGVIPSNPWNALFVLIAQSTKHPVNSSHCCSSCDNNYITATRLMTKYYCNYSIITLTFLLLIRSNFQVTRVQAKNLTYFISPTSQLQHI